MKIYSLNGYYEAVQERAEMEDLRDRIEERGGETSNLEKVIDEYSEAIGEYRRKSKDEFERI